ncbi:MAG: CBS domain-containing protein [bacterium]
MHTVKELLALKGSVVWTISAEASVYEALAIMADREIGALVVVNGAGVLGVISERDYARKIELRGRISKTTAVKDIMTPLPIVVRSSQTTQECMAMMTEKRIRHLPVIDNGKLVGIISIGDIVKSIISGQELLIKNLETYIVGTTLPV